jgi:hypothetical protein
MSAPRLIKLICEPYLLLNQLQLLCFEQLLGYALWACLCAEAEIPELLAELRSILVKKAGKLDLKDFDIRLCKFISLRRSIVVGKAG